MASDMTGKTCIVTGANSGIGRVTAEALAAAGASVVMISRSRERGEAAASEVRRATGNDAVELILADLSSQAEVRRAAAEFLAGHDRLDVLVNNAGAMHTSRTVTVDGLETTFATNHLAYFLLTNLLLGTLKASAPSRIVNVSSAAHYGSHINFADLQNERRYSAMRVYGQSKLANVLFTYELARRLEGTGVTANCLHPGVVRTGFGKNSDGPIGRLLAGAISIAGAFFISPEEGAETSIYLASSPEVEGVSGLYFAKCKPEDSNVESHDVEVARRLWDESERLTGVAAAGQPQDDGVIT